MGIVHRDIGPGASLRNLFLSQNILQYIRLDPHPVVRDQDHDPMFFLPTGKHDGPLLLLLFHDAVEDGVLHHRLEGQLRDRSFHQAVRHIHNKINVIRKPHVQQLHIDRHMLQLILDGAQGLLPAQRQLVEPGQLLHGHSHLLGTSLL